MTHDGEIVSNQLTDGNMGARGYFHKRVEMMLRSEQDADNLWRLMRKWWPSYRNGVTNDHQKGSDEP